MGRWRSTLLAIGVVATLAPEARPQDETPAAMGRKPTAGPREVSQARTWSVGVVLEPCGDVVIDRIDQYVLDGPPEQEPVTSRNQRKVLQWTVHGVVDRGLTLGQILAEMSQQRYAFRIWYRAAGVGGVKFLYFSPYGAAAEHIPPLPPEGVYDRTLLYKWKSLHAWSPRSPLNPEKNAFDHAFPQLLRHVDARMELPIRFVGPGCQAPTQAVEHIP